MNRWSALALLLALAGALALRCPRLDARPLHNDEAVNAFKLAALLEKGEYAYDPNEFHGPTLYYAARPFCRLSSGRDARLLDDGKLRWVTVAFGVGLILLLLLLADGLGRLATAWAAIFVAVSPAMVFYSRYFIHEMLLVFFSLLTIAAGWRSAQTRKPFWAVITGAGLGLMYATKETFIFSVFALGVAAAATLAWNRWWVRRSAIATGRDLGPRTKPERAWSWKRVALVLAAAVLVSQVLFSSCFTNASGPLDSLRTYLPWIKRAGGDSAHIHPWYFYFERLVWFHPRNGPVWTEGLILLLAGVGAVAAFFSNRTMLPKPTLARFLAFYTLMLTVIYCLIPYKTPWCLMNFWIGMILLAGVGAAVLLRLWQSRVAHALILAALAMGTGHLAWESWRASQTYAANRNNPYVYAQTAPDLLKLVARVEGIARVAPTGPDTVIKVIAPESYWPLPWYLRGFKNIGWWDDMPADPYAPIMIVSAKHRAALDEKSGKAYLMTGLYELRPGTFLELYVEIELWKQFVATLPRDGD